MYNKRQMELLGKIDSMPLQGGLPITGRPRRGASKDGISAEMRRKAEQKGVGDILQRLTSKEEPRRTRSHQPASQDDSPVVHRSKMGSSASESVFTRRSKTVDIGVVEGTTASGILNLRNRAVASSVLNNARPSSRTMVFGGGKDNGEIAADRAALLARQHRLNLQEVKQILKEFERHENEIISESEFEKVLCRIFEKGEFDKSVARSAHKASHILGSFSVDQFVSWYVQNMFASVNGLKADQSNKSTSCTNKVLSKIHGVDEHIMGKIKNDFDRYDTDGSGMIDYGEFQAMMCLMMKVSCVGDVGEERLQKFWKEIDVDGNGEIDFSEFVNWYMKYFYSADADSSAGQNFAIVQNYHNSFNPTLQRGKIVGQLNE